MHMVDLSRLAGANLREVRRVGDLKPVLYDPDYENTCGELPVYEIYRDCCDAGIAHLLIKNGLRYDLTVIFPALLGEEYAKTMGHYHLDCGEAGSHPEIFEVLEGEAQFLLQRVWKGEVDQVILLTAREGDRVLVPPGYGHVIINASSRQVIMGNLISRKCIQTNDHYVAQQGAAYYVLTNDRLVKNPRYFPVPEIQVLEIDPTSVLERQESLLQTLIEEPHRLGFLNDAKEFWRQHMNIGAPELSRPKVAVVIPTMNEADSIGEVVEGISRCLDGYSEIVVMDASVDNTSIVAAGSGAKVLKQQGKGKGCALREAFDILDADTVIMMDGDGSMNPEEIPGFLQAIFSGADVVKGSRFLRGGGSEDFTFLRRLGNRFFISLANLLWAEGYTDLCYGFIAFRGKALDTLKPYLASKGFQIETEICIKARRLGLRVAEIPSLELKRKSGRSKLNIIRDSLCILQSIVRECVSRDCQFPSKGTQRVDVFCMPCLLTAGHREPIKRASYD